MIYFTANDQRVLPILPAVATPARCHPTINAPRYVCAGRIGTIIVWESVDKRLEWQVGTKEEAFDLILSLRMSGRVSDTDLQRLRTEIQLSTLPYGRIHARLGLGQELDVCG